MENQDDPKFDFKAPEDNNIRKWEPKKWEDNAFQGVSPFDFAMRQKNEDKKRKEGDRAAKAKLYNYQSKGVATMEEANALKLNADNAKVKQQARQNIEDAKRVGLADFGVEQASRNADYNRDKAWKETKKQEIAAQKDVNMAISGFGIEQASRTADYNRDKAWKETKKQEIAAQKDVNMAISGFGIEQASRTADYNRDKAWKETKKQEIAKHAEFDMARALF
jgi:hypothetical protein